MKVVIVGAGVIGMLLARELGQAGVSVTLLDKGLCGKEASWAGGGILSPLYPWRYPDAVTALARWSQQFYPNLLESLEAESGIDAELSRHGMLILDTDEKQRAMEWAETQHIPVELLDADGLYQKESQLRKGLKEALWMPSLCSIRNPKLLKALRQSIELDPAIQVVEQSAFEDFFYKGKRVIGVKTSSGDFYADKIAVCAGAWSGSILTSIGIPLPVKPIRGQMVLFKAEPGVVSTMVMKEGKYVIPRRDGRVLAGSTIESVGFEKATTPQAKDLLTDMAIDLFPKLANYPVEHHWAGLRPSSPRGIPFIGAVSGREGLYVNAGQFRNGLVLAPASACLLGSMLMDKKPLIDPSPYVVMRDDVNMKKS